MANDRKAKGDGCIYKRKDGRYTVALCGNYTTAKDEESAKAKLTEMKIEASLNKSATIKIKNSIILEAFLNMIREADTTSVNAYALMETENKKAQDYLHKLELENLNYKERAKLSTKLVENRRQRRKYKDEFEEVAPIADFADDNEQFINKLEQLLGKIRKIEKYHENRQYYPRINKED